MGNLAARCLKRKLAANVCKFRGYVLESCPESYSHAERLFMESADGDMGGEGEGEGEDEEIVKTLNTALCPEFVVTIESTEESCKERALEDGVLGEDDFRRLMDKYKKENLAEDGSPAMADFFKDKANGLEALSANVDDSASDADTLRHIRSYVEKKGRPFNYLKTERELAVTTKEEQQETEVEVDAEAERERSELNAKEETLRAAREKAEAERLDAIAANETQLLESRSLPLRQYLLQYVVPTLSDGLTEICKV